MIPDSDIHDIIGDPESSMTDKAPIKLCGKVGHDLIMNVKQNKFGNPVDMGRALFKFFINCSGSKEFWDLLDMLINKKPIDPTNKILTSNDIARAYYAKIEQLETASPFSFLGTSLAKKEDRQIECAKMYLKLGDVKKYCEIMMSLGFWEKAIAFAPYVSLFYWKSCVENYAKFLHNNPEDDFLGYQILGYNIRDAVSDLIRQEKYEEAKLVKILGDNSVYTDATKNFKEHKQATHPLHATFDAMSGEGKQSILKISCIEANEYFNDGEAVLASSAELAIEDHVAAILKLIRANELYLAYYLAQLLKVPVLDQINFFLGMRSEKIGELEQAAFYFQNSKNPRRLQIFASKYNLNEKKYLLKSKEEYEKLAPEARGADAIFYLLLAGNIKSAATMIIEKAKDFISNKKYDMFDQMLEMIELIQNYEIKDLPIDIKAEILYYSSLIGVFKSLWLGFIHVTKILLVNCKNIEDHSNVKPGINYDPINELKDKVIKKIEAGNENKIESKVESMTNKEYKALTKAMLKSIKSSYSMGNLIINNRVSFI